MNIDEIKSKVSEVKTELNNANFDNFADKNRKTSRPEKINRGFSDLLKQLEIIANEALKKFPNSGIDSLINEGQELLNVRKRAVKNIDFEKGKETLLDAVRILEANLADEEKKRLSPVSPKIVRENPTQQQPTMIFVSYYNEQIMEEIQTVFDMLGSLDSEMVDLPAKKGDQSDSLDTIVSRIEEIKSCSSAIICLPQKNSSDDEVSNLVYIDLGACLARFTDKTLLIHQGEGLPNNLASRVETFHYLGNLDLKKGMELARKILSILHKDG